MSIFFFLNVYFSFAYFTGAICFLPKESKSRVCKLFFVVVVVVIVVVPSDIFLSFFFSFCDFAK